MFDEQIRWTNDERNFEFINRKSAIDLILNNFIDLI